MDITLYRTDIQKLIADIQQSRGKDPLVTLERCNDLEKYGMENKEDALVGFAQFTRGETYYLMNDMPNFYHEMLSCMEPLERIKEWGYLAMANNMLGIMSLNRGNAPFAMDYYFKAMHYCQEYKLPELEWMVHMNMGTLYVTIEEYDHAIFHFQHGYHFIKSNEGYSDQTGRLMAIYLGMGKAYLGKKEYDNALIYIRRIDAECIADIPELDRVVIYCFAARLFHQLEQTERTDYYIDKVHEAFSDQIPIMDEFDDFYEYLEMLLEMDKSEEFFFIIKKVEDLTKKTMVKYLEKKLIELYIRYYRQNQDQESYQTYAMTYFELCECMERENEMMISNMISLRDNLYHLTKINKEVEKKNRALQRKTESDPLTKMNNRLRLNEYGEEAFERAFHNQLGFAVEILDIDFFKEFNDNYGHQAGDKCIKFVADSIMSLQKYPGVFTARYGGDEFVVIYEGYSENEVFEIATELKDIITSAAYEHKYSRIKSKIVTISQGIFWGIPENGNAIWNYLHAADNLLYKVKSKSRNSIMLGQNAANGEEEITESSGEVMENKEISNPVSNIEDEDQG